jgi:hypothetical protein
MAAHPQTLPNVEEAVIHPDKLRRYALDPTNAQGAHKARVFASVLGITLENAEELESQILSKIRSCAAVERKSTEYGRLFSVDIPITGPSGSGIVRTGWQIDVGQSVPRLVSAYVVRG